MITYKRSRKGSTIIPAVFLLLFIIMFGATLVKGVLLSTNFSTRTLDKRQAYLLAESATNYICDTLTGSQTAPLFTTLDTVLEGITSNNTIIQTPLEINSQIIDTQIQLNVRQVSTNETIETFTVTSLAKQGSASQKVSRQLTATRLQGGLGDMTILGTSEKTKRDPGIYSIGSAAGRNPDKIIGSVRFENIESFICSNIIVKGDLYIAGDLARALTINLSKVTIEKNLYIITSAKSGNATIHLTDVNVNGDILIHTSGTIAMTGTIKAKNLYVYTKDNKISDNGLSASSTISNIYLSSNITQYSTIKSIFSSNIINNNTAADKIISDLHITHSRELAVDVSISNPAVYDFEFSKAYNISTGMLDDNKKTLEFDFTKQKVYNISVSETYGSLTGTFKMAGSGAVNIYINEKMYDTILLNDFIVEHASGSTAAVNIIYMKESGILLYNRGTPLNANLVVPNGSIQLFRSSVKGIGVAKAYTFDAPASLGYFFSNKISEGSDALVPWADFGGALPGLGVKSVSYTYGKYIK